MKIPKTGPWISTVFFSGTVSLGAGWCVGIGHWWPGLIVLGVDLLILAGGVTLSAVEEEREDLRSTTVETPPE